MTTYLYVEINCLCIGILILLLVNLKNNREILFDIKLFMYVIVCTIALLVVDTFEVSLDGATFIGAEIINNLLGALYFFLVGLLCLLWVIYTDYKMDCNRAALEKRLLFYLIPFGIISLISLTSPFTHIFFFIDNNAVYHRGELYSFHLVACWLYFVYSDIFSFIKLIKDNSYVKRRECSLILTFSVIPFIGSLIQSLFYGTTLLLPCVTYALTIIFMNVQNMEVSLDPLTKINNRGQLNKYLNSKIATLKRTKKMFLILIDVDKFKSINDTYGHVEGDNALISVANILKKVCATERGNMFLARYGGDEFAIVCVAKDARKIYNILDTIQEWTAEWNGNTKAPYRLSLSAGYSEFNGTKSNAIESLIASADEQMYQHKLKKKAFCNA